MKFARSCQLLVLVALFAVPGWAQRFGPWSAPVNIGPPVNSVNTEFQPFIAKDGLSLYWAALPNNLQNGPLYTFVSKRDSEDQPWGTPLMLGPEINFPPRSGQPFVTVDGHYLYFNANRPGGFGGTDIWVSKRQNKREDVGPMGWQEPVNLGSGVNTPANENSPWVFEDETTGITYLYFASSRSGNADIYVSTLQPDGSFGPAQPLAELNTPFTDGQLTLSRDGLEMYFISDRPGSNLYPVSGCCGPAGQPSPDVWVSTRASTSDPWGEPVNLDVFNAALGGPSINSQFHDGKPSLSFDGTTLYFYSAFRDGNQSMFFDIWKTTREKLTGPQ